MQTPSPDPTPKIFSASWLLSGEVENDEVCRVGGRWEGRVKRLCSMTKKFPRTPMDRTT